MKFKLQADATFEADGIDDAFIKLSNHFKSLAEEGVESPWIFCGSIGIKPENKEEV
jgi:hypothetical protein